MEFPGEKLVIRLWDTVAEKAIGNLFKPWQMRREGRALADVRRDELLVLAQTEVDAAEIRSGRTRLLSDGRGHGPEAEPLVQAALHAPTTTPLEELAHAVTDAVIADKIRTEVNITRALLSAERELETDATVPPEEKVNEDWLFRWRDAAAEVSESELQQVWGRVLAGEIKSPGSVSLRTLDFLKNISQQEAKAIERLADLAVEHFVFRNDDALKAHQVNFQFLLEMQELGLISGVEALGLEMTMATTVKGSYLRVIRVRDKGLLIRAIDESKELKLPIYPITSTGKQVLKLGNPVANVALLRTLGTAICAQGFQVSMVNCVDIQEGKIQCLDPEDLCAPASAVG